MLALVLLNGVFSGAEIALLSVRRTRVQELIDEGSRGARAIEGLRAEPERLLATVQVGITVIGAAAAAFGGSSIADRVAGWLRLMPLIAPWADQIAFVAVVAGVSYLSLVLGELVPKSLALRAAEAYALVVAPPLAWLAWAARPVVWVLTTSSNVVLRLFGDHTSFSESRLSPEEIQQLVDEASSAGTVDPDVGEIASRALDFHDIDLSVVMVPRGRIAAVPRDATLDALAKLAAERGHTRVLVHEGDLDQVVGYVNVREVLARARVETAISIAGTIRAVPFLPDTMDAPGALRAMQHQRVPLAVVVDEQGTVRGLVTIEDLVEELVGEILTEGDPDDVRIRKEPDGSSWIAGSTPVHEAARALGIELPESEAVATIGGLVTQLAGRIPHLGDRFALDQGVTLEVVEVSSRRVKAVRVRPTSSGGS